MEKIFWNILDKQKQKIVKILSNFSEINNFYLAGGTGLALRIGHRKSLDFDFFSRDIKLLIEDREKIKTYLKNYGNIKLLQDKDNTLDLIFHETHISFFYYSYPIVKPLQSFKGINFASIEDIGLMKLSAIITRGSKKDFIDVYFVCNQISLEKLFFIAEKKFTEVYDFQVSAMKALTYFIDAEKEKMPVMLQPVDWAEIKDFFIKTSKKLIFK